MIGGEFDQPVRVVAADDGVGDVGIRLVELPVQIVLLDVRQD